jgi:hypothetical protein
MAHSTHILGPRKQLFHRPPTYTHMRTHPHGTHTDLGAGYADIVEGTLPPLRMSSSSSSLAS